MSAHDAWLRDQAAARERAGLHRDVRARQPGETVLDLAGNDYLGLARDPRVVAAAAEAAALWGTGSTGSRLVTGTTQLHADLEASLAAFTGSPAALVFATGYAANLAALTALADDDTLIVSDEHNHASLVDGCRLARGRVVVTPHRDVAAVANALRQRHESKALVVTDAVFSVDGALAPIDELHAAAREHGALLVIDEAHALGVVGAGGRGLATAIAAESDVVRTVTLSKALGAQGGAVLASAAVVAHLADTARTFIFDTGLAPAAAAAALRAVQLLDAEPALVDAVRRNAASLAAGLDLPQPTAAVVSLVLGDPVRAVTAAEKCLADGVRVGCFRPPSVPVGTSRLRITARADLTNDDIARAVTTIRTAVG